MVFEYFPQKNKDIDSMLRMFHIIKIIKTQYTEVPSIVRVLIGQHGSLLLGSTQATANIIHIYFFMF